MDIDHEHFVQQGLALSLSVAAACFLLVMLLGNSNATGAPRATGQQSFSIAQSPKRISAAIERSLTALGWTQQAVAVTTSNAYLEALTAQGIPVKVSVICPAGQTSRISLHAVAPRLVSKGLTQQLHDALLLALQ